MDEAVYDAEMPWDFGRLDEAGIGDFVGDAERMRARFDLRAERAIADEEEAGLSAAREDRFGREQEIVVAFERREPANFADYKVIGRETELLAQGGIVPSLKEGFEGKAAEDAGVHFGAANACGEIEASHGIGGAEEVSGVAGGELFGG